MSAPIYKGGRPYFAPGIRFDNNTGVFNTASEPVDGTSGTLAGVAGPGSILMRTNGAVYVNTNTKASPTWVSLGVGAAGSTLDDPTLTGTVTLTGADVVDGTFAGSTLTAPTINGPAIVAGVVTPAEAGALTAADSGKTIFLDAAAGFEIALPAVATSAGVRYRFVVAAAFATSNFTVFAATAVIQGGAIVNSVYVPAVDEDTISFVATAETIGDYIDLECDGTNWLASGVGALTGSITFTDAA